LPEMTESSSRAVRCGGTQTRSPNFYLELLSRQYENQEIRSKRVLIISPNKVLVLSKTLQVNYR
jgi:hypothetical protein